MTGMDISELKSLAFWRAALAEYVATTMFLITVSFAAIQSDVVTIALAIGLAITTLAQCFGPISGGHINPAVTFGIFIARKITAIKCVVYIVCQCLGAITGSGIAYALVPASVRGGLGVTNLASHVTPGQGFCIELLLTALLVYTVFAVIDERKGVEPYGATLAIGISIVVSHLAAIKLTGSAINPARSLGPAVVMASWDNHWVYWVGPMLGGAMAGLAYEFVFFVDGTRNQADISTIEMTHEKHTP